MSGTIYRRIAVTTWCLCQRHLRRQRQLVYLHIMVFLDVTQQLSRVHFGAANPAFCPHRTFISDKTIWSQTEAISVALTLNIL